MMKKTLLSLSIAVAGTAVATPFTSNDAPANGMGNTGVASADAVGAVTYNPALLANYPDDVGLGISLFGIKSSIEDTEGFGDAAQNFIEEGGTWDSFKDIDSTALEAAVDAIPTTLTDITTDLNDINSAIAAAEAAEDASDQSAFDAAIDSLNTATTSLTNNATTLDTDVVIVDTQINNIDVTVTTADEDLNDLTGKPLQLGIGINLLNVALPSDSLGWGVSISSTTAASAKLTLSNDDLEPIINLSGDLSVYSTEVIALSASVTVLANANAALTDHVNNAPAISDSAYAAWETELNVRQTAVTDALNAVEAQQTVVEEFDGDNGTITDGVVDVTVSDDPQSEIEIIGATISEVAVPIARQFNYQGQSFSAGITPKFQIFNIFEKTLVLGDAEDEADEISEDPVGYFRENSTTEYRANIDIGVAKTWDYHGSLRVGASLKDIIPWDLETESGNTLIVRPKLRIATAHETQFTTLAVDLDVTENKPLKYGVATRYFAIGGEVRAWQHAALRLGYRNNLSVDDSHVLSTGLGLTPFGIGIDLSAWAKPKFNDATEVIQDAGAAVQLSMNF